MNQTQLAADIHSEHWQRLDDLARAMMQTRPELEPMSLDDWLATHRDRLTETERGAASAILELYWQEAGQ